MTLPLRESYAWCRSLSRRRADNFYFSFWTLPTDRFRDMCVLYAYMRICDDLGDDESVSADERDGRLRQWRENLDAALDRDAYRHEVFPALADVVRRYGIPRDYLLDVIDGVRADLRPAGFETFDELAHYCYQVAGAVGLCCIYVWGFHDRRAIQFAVDCGTALQLTNILRDLGEDARMGRVYLPRDELRRFDYAPQDIAGHCRDERFARLMQFQVERAKSYYRRADGLFACLDPPGRPVYAAMLDIYGGLLSEIERRDYDVYSNRIALSRRRKMFIALRSIVRHRWLARFGDKTPRLAADLKQEQEAELHPERTRKGAAANRTR